MSTTIKSELEKERDELALRKVAGKPQHIEINERTLVATREEYTKKGMSVSKEEDYPMEDYHLVKKQKEFDALVDPSQGIRKVIESMTRQPVTVFNKQGKPEIKDALYYRGTYYGQDKKGTDLGAPFVEGYYKKPRLVFTSTDPANPFDPKTGERRGSYKPSGWLHEHYIFLPEKQEDRVKSLKDIIQNSPGTYTGNLQLGGHLSYRNPTPTNDHSGTHGGDPTWELFCNLSIEELGQLQNHNYYTEKSTGAIKDKTGQRVAYDHSTKKVETTTGR